MPTNGDLPGIFVITGDYILGTPDGIRESKRTVDMKFSELANNYDLQVGLNMASAISLKPAFGPPISRPREGRELIEGAACYLTSLSEHSDKKNEMRDYLTNDGLVRLIIKDEKIRSTVE